jgi:hypothetical protein
MSDKSIRDHNTRDRDRLGIADVIGEIPWPDTWCSEAFMDRIARSERNRLSRSAVFDRDPK